MKTLHATHPYTILRATVGSTVHGLALEGADDLDEMAVAIEPPEFLVGLARAKFDLDGKFQQGLEHVVERTQPEGERSGPGDLDRTTYSLRKWMRLACAGNPTVLLLLFVPDEYVGIRTEFGTELQELAPYIISKGSGPKFMGYMHSQKLRLLGERGQKNVKRPELEETYGFDTKYAMHVLRLGMQGAEVMRTGRLTLPMNQDARTVLRMVRKGEIELEETLHLIEAAEEDLGHAVAGSKLPDEPNWSRINDYLCRTYREVWGW